MNHPPTGQDTSDNAIEYTAGSNPAGPHAAGISFAGTDPNFANVAGTGLEYYPSVGVGGAPQDLPLYVSRNDDEALFVENIAMWNQFVFGWDDFADPRVYYEELDPNNLSDVRVSAQREHFRGH